MEGKGPAADAVSRAARLKTAWRAESAPEAAPIAGRGPLGVFDRVMRQFPRQARPEGARLRCWQAESALFVSLPFPVAPTVIFIWFFRVISGHLHKTRKVLGGDADRLLFP